MRIARIVFLLLLLPYVLWTLGQDHFHPRALFAGLLVVAAVVPLIATRFVPDRLRGTVTSLVVTPVVLCVVLLIAALGDREGVAWFPLTAVWAVVKTAPVWVGVSVVFGAMKDAKQETSVGLPPDK